MATVPSPQRPTRVRIRKCKAKLRVPADGGPAADAIFTCEKDAHGSDTLHEDHGIIEMPNGTGREYTITWRDLGLLTFRRRMKINESTGGDN